MWDFFSVLKFIGVVVTAMAGIYGTFELRAEGRLTRAGRVAVAVILFGCVLAVGIQWKDAQTAQRAAAELRRQIARQEITLRQLNSANALLTTTLATLQQVRDRQRESTRELGRRIDEQRAAATTLDKSVTSASDAATSHLKRVDQMLNNLDALTSREVARLARPMNDVGFDYVLVYDNADVIFADYYDRLSTLRRQPDFKPDPYVVSNNPSAITITPTSPYLPMRTEAVAYDRLLQDFTAIVLSRTDKHGKRIAWRRYEVTPWRGLNDDNMFKRSYFTLTIDFANKRITKFVLGRGAAVELAEGYGALTSELDLLQPTDPDHTYITIAPNQPRIYPQPYVQSLDILLGQNGRSSVYAQEFDTVMEYGVVRYRCPLSRTTRNPQIE